MDINSLASHDIEQSLIETWKGSGISTLTECQAKVLSHQSLWEGKNILVVAPTSAGKTFVGEVLAAKSAFSLKRAIFLVPYKAIAEEKYAEFRKRYRNLGISVVISDGDHTQFDRDIIQGNFGIAVIVYEKLAQLLIQSPGILINCPLIVVDEIQMIGDQTRGPSLEILLTHIRRMVEQPQIIGLSATMSELGGLDSWLGADVVNVPSRPVPLWECIAFPTGSTEMENAETNGRQSGLDLTSVAIPQTTWESGTKLDVAYRILLSEGLSKQSLIFRTKVDDTVATARKLAHVLPVDPVDPEVRSRIGALEETRVSEFLNQWIDKRVAYHNAGLSLEERRLIEQLFREGIIRVLVTTSTLAAGVNTPADVVILLDYKRYNFAAKTSLPIPVVEYKNSVGRAGRFGMTSEGHSYLVVDSSSETHLVRNNFLQGQSHPIRSSMPEAGDVGVMALRLLGMGVVSNDDDLRDFIRHSFAFNQYFNSKVERDRFLAQFMESLGDLEANNLTLSDNGALTVTDLGRVAATSGMALASFYKLLNAIKDPAMNKDSITDLIPIICQLQEFQALRPYDDGKRAQVLDDWVVGCTTSEIIDTYSSQYEIGSGHIRSIGATAAWMLNTASKIASIPGLLVDGETISKELSDLSHQCKFGVPSPVVPIAELQVLRRSELNLLVNNAKGKVLDTPHKILDTELGDFVGILSPQRAERLKAAILDQIGESLLSKRFGHASRADRFSGLRPLVERCYDAQGTAVEIALEELLKAQFLNLGVHRFAKQRTGQPDLEITGSKGTIVVQVTASIDNRKPVNWDKARQVPSSVGYSGTASNFVTVARPEFHDVAIGNANEMAGRADQKLLLIPLSVLIEVFLSEVEGTLPQGELLRILEDKHGHFVGQD